MNQPLNWTKIESYSSIKCPIIYGLIDPDTNELRYVGKSLKGSIRCFEHLRPSSLKNDSKTHKANWIQYLLSQNKKPIPVLLSKKENSSNEELYEIEQFFIDFYRELGMQLTNHCDAGPGMTGFQFSEESRKKMSESAKKRGLPEALKVMQQKKYGPKVPKHLNRASRAIPGAWEKNAKDKGIKVLGSSNGIEISFFSLRDAARFLGGKANKTGIRLAIQNKKSYYNFTWSLI